MRVLIISGEGFEDRELHAPRDALHSAGIAVEVATPSGATIHGKHGATVRADLAVEEVDPTFYDLLVLPGGKAPAVLRKDRTVVGVVSAFFAARKPVAAICHGPEILIAAAVLRGKRATAYKSVVPELQAAGAHFVDAEVVVDENLITARKPSDLPAFVNAIYEKLGLPARP